MNKNTKVLLSLVLTFVMTFAPVFSVAGMAMEDNAVQEDAVEESSKETVAATASIIAPTVAYGWTTSRPSGSYVSAWGTPANAIASGPLNNSVWYYQVSTQKNTNNWSYTIPQVSTLFTLNPGWEIDYVNVGGNSSGQRQPGASMLLSMSGGSMVYYFKQRSATLTTQTAVDGSVVASSNKSLAVGSSTSVSPSTGSFDTANYNYTFTGWTVVSGTGSFVSSGSESTTFSMSSSGATIRANYTKTPKPVTLSIQTAIDGTVMSTFTRGTYASGTNVSIYPDSAVLTSGEYVFTGWTLVSGIGTFTDRDAQNTNFVTGSSATVIRANFEKAKEYMLTLETVVNGEVVATQIKGSYLSGTQVSISPDKSGFSTSAQYVFKGWSIVSGQGSLTNSTSENASFRTGAADTVLQAVYEKEDRYELIVETEINGEVITRQDKGYYAPGTDVDIEPDKVNFDPRFYDYTFEGWIIVSGSGFFADASDEETVFTTDTADTVVRAVYTVEERTIIAECTVFLRDIDTGDIKVIYTEQLQGAGAHRLYPDVSKVPAGYELYPDGQYMDMEVVATDSNDYINGMCVPGAAIFTIRKVDEEVKADLTVKLAHYQTEEILGTYIETLGVGTHRIYPDASQMPSGYSAYPESQFIDVTVNTDGSINPAEIIFYIAEINPTPGPTSPMIFFNPNKPAGATLVSGNDQLWVTMAFKTGERMPLPAAFNETNPPVYQGYKFIGWSVNQSGTPLLTESYMIPMTATVVNLYAVWEPI